jgi:hypothetical protein
VNTCVFGAYGDDNIPSVQFSGIKAESETTKQLMYLGIVERAQYGREHLEMGVFVE